jgi:integrase
MIDTKSYDWAELVVRCHLRPFFGGLKVSNVTTGATARHIARRQAEGAKNATINREIVLLRRAFNLAYRSTPPKVSRAPYFPKLEENDVHKGFFEHADYLSLRDALPDELRPVLMFANFTGCRKEEILGLRWDQVN